MDMSKEIFEWHETGAFLILAFVALHILAAIYHKFIRKDRVVERMSTRTKSSDADATPLQRYAGTANVSVWPTSAAARETLIQETTVLASTAPVSVVRDGVSADQSSMASGRAGTAGAFAFQHQIAVETKLIGELAGGQRSYRPEPLVLHLMTVEGRDHLVVCRPVGGPFVQAVVRERRVKCCPLFIMAFASLRMKSSDTRSKNAEAVTRCGASSRSAV